MAWDIEYADEFGQWWDSLTESEQIAVTATVQLQETIGPRALSV